MLDAGRQRLVFADLVTYRRMPAGREIYRPAGQQELPVGGDLGRGRVVNRAKILGAADQHETRRDDQPLPKTAELLPRVEGQHVDPLPQCCSQRCGDEIGRGTDIGIDKAQPFRIGLQRALPAGVWFAHPAGR